MKKIYFICILFLLSLHSVLLYGQNRKIVQNDSVLDKITNVDSKVKEFVKVDTIGGIAFRQMVDSLLEKTPYKAPRDANGLLLKPENNWIPFGSDTNFNDTVIFDPKFLPVVFDGKILPDHLTFLSDDSSFVKTDKSYSFHLIDRDVSISNNYKKAMNVRDERKVFYLSNPDHIKYNGLAFAKHPILKDNSLKKSSIFDKLLQAESTISVTERPELDKVRIKASKWRVEGDHSLTASFNHISGNWNGGGNSSYGVSSRQIMNIDYKHKKLSVKNIVEWKLSMQKLKGDDTDKRDYEINEDYLRLETTMGYDAFDKWAYSLKLNAKTPLFNAYKNTNSNYRVRAFLSPFDFDIGPGMSYSLTKQSKVDKARRIKLDLDIQPFVFKFRSIRSEAVNYKDYGMETTITETELGKIEKTKSYKWERGTQVILKSNINFNRYCSLDSRINYFTNYSYTLFEWENTLKYYLNRYLGIVVSPYYRFDDETFAKKSGNHGYSQLKFKLEFGLQYKW